ncbi:MAG TPA: OmpA family protein [Conexibacter sp.]|nr:OmpA family protein [Conexibacter sp.]
MSNALRRISIAAGSVLALGAAGARADDAGVTLSGSLGSSGADARADSTSSPSSSSGLDQAPWGVDGGTWELGMYWGVLRPDGRHQLFDPDLSEDYFQKLERVTPELGLRAGYLPLSVLGLELEAGLLPSQTRKSGDGVNLFAVRAHLLLQAPTRAIVPFLAIGGGMLGISSEDDVLGSDVDPEVHIGLGVKAFVTRDVELRIDVRDNLSEALPEDTIAQHWEALLGFSIVGGRAEPPPPPPSDTDGDGITDDRDLCKTAAGPAPDGCPPPPDADGDGIVDADDKCPNEAGVESADASKRGCPPPPPDGDGDGVPDATDKCPAEAGDGPDGCLQDSDGDGLFNRDDKCAAEPETKNGYEDEDGCPDELPQAVQQFTGAITGISFAANQAKIKPSSFPTLDAAAKVLSEYPALRVEISGHTDSSGKAERNLELSAQRADAVKTYLVGKGVAAERVTTRGAGSNEPAGDDATKEGRAQNRRIEFKLLQ